MDESEGSLGETNEETSGDDGGIVVDDQATCQDRVAVEDGEGRVADGVVDQSPVKRSQRVRKPNSKYDPAVFDWDSVEMRGIPLSGRKNGWKGVYWPKWSPFNWGGEEELQEFKFHFI